VKLEEATQLLKKLLTLATGNGEGLVEGKLVLDRNGEEWNIVLDSREINRQIMDEILPLLGDKIGFQFHDYNEMRIYTYEPE